MAVFDVYRIGDDRPLWVKVATGLTKEQVRQVYRDRFSDPAWYGKGMRVVAEGEQPTYKADISVEQWNT